MKIGVYNASVFIGYNPGGFDMGTDEVLQEAELGDGAIGFLAGGLNLGFVMASFVRGLFTRTMGEQVPTFYAIQGLHRARTHVGRRPRHHPEGVRR